MTTWNSLYSAAIQYGQPDPNKFATTSLRCRERALEIRAARHKVIMITETPPSVQVAATATVAPKKSSAPQCTARTLEGRQCPFKMSPGCGSFCKKHYHMV